MSILQTACSQFNDGSEQSVERSLRILNLIKRFNPSFDHVDNFHRSPLHNACRAKNFTAMKFLFENGEKNKFIDLQTIGGVTALMYAAEQGNMQ